MCTIQHATQKERSRGPLCAQIDELAQNAEPLCREIDETMDLFSYEIRDVHRPKGMHPHTDRSGPVFHNVQTGGYNCFQEISTNWNGTASPERSCFPLRTTDALH